MIDKINSNSDFTYSEFKITSIEQQKKNKKRYNIYIDNSFAFGLDEEVLYFNNIKENMILSKDFIENVLKKEEQIKANNYAINLLSYSTKTTKELTDKMKEKGYEDNIIENTIEMLKQYNYINDKQYVENYINDKLYLNSDGSNKIKMKLIQKGIDKNLINEYINNIDEDIEYDNAFKIAERKINSYSKFDLNIQKKKLYTFLLNRGYGYDVVKRVITDIFTIE